MASVKETQAGSSLIQAWRGRSTGDGPVLGTLAAREEEEEEEEAPPPSSTFSPPLLFFFLSPPPPPPEDRSSEGENSLSRIGATTPLRG